MEENKELLELLKRIEETNRKQARYLKITTALALVALTCFLGAFLMIFNILPQIMAVVTQLDEVAVRLPEIVQQMDVVLDNLETVTAELATVDFSRVVDSVDNLVQTGQAGLEGTVEKLESIDFESLNKTIQDLADVVEPLAKFFKNFR